MTRRSVSSRLRRLAVIVLALFAVCLATGQLEHHDLACHIKTPQHCSACASSPVGSDPHAQASRLGIELADAGGAVARSVLLEGTVLPPRCSGRSPPTRA